MSDSKVEVEDSNVEMPPPTLKLDGAAAGQHNATAAKLRGGLVKRKASRIMKFISEEEALLKEMGHPEDGPELEGRRRTRSSRKVSYVVRRQPKSESSTNETPKKVDEKKSNDVGAESKVEEAKKPETPRKEEVKTPTPIKESIPTPEKKQTAAPALVKSASPVPVVKSASPAPIVKSPSPVVSESNKEEKKEEPPAKKEAAVTSAPTPVAVNATPEKKAPAVNGANEVKGQSSVIAAPVSAVPHNNSASNTTAPSTENSTVSPQKAD